MDFDSIRLELEALEEKLNTLKNAIKVEEKKQKGAVCYEGQVPGRSEREMGRAVPSNQLCA